MAGIEMTHVPYKGSTAAHPDLISGQTSMMFDTVAAIMQHVKSGSVRALAVTTAKRALSAPDVRERLTTAGIEPVGGTPAQFGAFIQAEMIKWGKVAKDAGVQPE
jgi:tripartite-type tricarboxylate transporter receptor subunit TctC